MCRIRVRGAGESLTDVSFLIEYAGGGAAKECSAPLLKLQDRKTSILFLSRDLVHWISRGTLPEVAHINFPNCRLFGAIGVPVEFFLVRWN